MAGGAPIPVVNLPTSVRQLLEIYFDTPLRTIPRESDVTVGTSAVKLGQWPNVRTAITLGNTGSALVVIGFSPGVTVTTGLPLQTNTGITFNWFADNELVMYDIWAISGSAGQTVHVVESVLSGA